jgi:hypothetical protein
LQQLPKLTLLAQLLRDNSFVFGHGCMSLVPFVTFIMALSIALRLQWAVATRIRALPDWWFANAKPTVEELVPGTKSIPSTRVYLHRFPK